MQHHPHTRPHLSYTASAVDGPPDHPKHIEAPISDRHMNPNCLYSAGASMNLHKYYPPVLLDQNLPSSTYVTLAIFCVHYCCLDTDPDTTLSLRSVTAACTTTCMCTHACADQASGLAPPQKRACSEFAIQHEPSNCIARKATP